MIQNANIEYSIRLEKGSRKGEIIKIFTDIDELEEEDLSGILVDDGYLESYSNREDYYTILERKIIIE